MEYQNRVNGNTQEASLNGKLTFEDMAIFRQMIKDFQSSDANKWIVDLSKLEFIDSAGLGLLLRVKAAAESKNAAVSLRVPSDGKVRKMMEVSRFDQLITFEN